MNNFFENFKLKHYEIFFSLIKDNKKAFYLLSLLFILQIIFISSSIFSLVPLADYLLDPNLDNPNKITSYFLVLINNLGLEPSLTLFILVFVILTILKSISEIFISSSIYKIKYSIEKKYYTNFIENILKTEWNFFFKFTSGDLLNVYTNLINGFCNGFMQIAVQLANISKIFAYLAVPTIINYKITLLAVSLGLLVILPLKIFNRISFSLGEKNIKANNEFLLSLSETLQSIKLIFGFNNQEKIINKNANLFKSILNYGLKTSILNIIVTNSFAPIGIIVAASTFFFFSGSLNDLPILAAIFWSLVSSIPSLQSVIQGNLEIANLSTSYIQFKKINDQAILMKKKNGSLKFNKFLDEIEFKDVSFGYHSDNLLIDKVNFKLKRNETYLIFGESGIGKSTLIDLIMGFQKAKDGKILIDKVDLNEIDIYSFRSKIGYVPQDPFLFSGTILDNIIWSNDKVDETEVQNILKLSNCSKFIKDLPKGLSTLVGERGSQLSGGQRQRIALARALVKKPEILILDEATSSLDDESSNLIRESLNELKNKITIIMISHEKKYFENIKNILHLKGKKIELIKNESL